LMVFWANAEPATARTAQKARKDRRFIVNAGY
jgi:hypothetical protein